jgi:predicted  nucleic acid-binding Zn-ribbon protein
MQEVLAALLRLQELDQHIFRAQAELKRLPAERAQRKSELDRRAQKLADTRAEAQRLKVRIKELEDASTVQRQRARKVENEAAAARQDMALLVAFQHEIRTLKREINNAEEQGLELVGQVEALEKDAEAQEQALAAEQVSFGEYDGNVQRELAAAQKRLDELGAERKKRLTGAIPPEALTTYNRLLAAREGQALAELDGKACQACFMDVPANVVVRVQRGSELVNCPGCSRILFQRG